MEVDSVPEPFDATTGRQAEEAQAAQLAWAGHLDLKVVEENAVGMNLVLIPPGEFLMGSPESLSSLYDDEKPQHRIRITRPYFLQSTEVTQAQWQSVMDSEPWQGEYFVREGEDFAASFVSLENAREFCQKLSVKEGFTYRLPTEAEWEYACRAGTTTFYHFGDAADRLGEYAWFGGNTWEVDERYAHEVGGKKPNAFGLYDMHGNVEEWCQDGYDRDFYWQFASKTAVDPQGRRSRSGH